MNIFWQNLLFLLVLVIGPQDLRSNKTWKPWETEHPVFEFIAKSMKPETKTLSEFPNKGKAIVEQILASEEKNKPKTAGMWESQSGIWVGKLTILVWSFFI